jgi:hypothetical protein
MSTIGRLFPAPGPEPGFFCYLRSFSIQPAHIQQLASNMRSLRRLRRTGSATHYGKATCAFPRPNSRTARTVPASQWGQTITWIVFLTKTGNQNEQCYGLTPLMTPLTDGFRRPPKHPGRRPPPQTVHNLLCLQSPVKLIFCPLRPFANPEGCQTVAGGRAPATPPDSGHGRGAPRRRCQWSASSRPALSP